jgi:hypothetical protein
MSAIEHEQNPAVRGRAAVLFLRDLSATTRGAEAVLDGAVRELRSRGLSEARIATLLDIDRLDLDGRDREGLETASCDPDRAQVPVQLDLVSELHP